MILLVNNISHHATAKELTKFIESAISSWIPFKSGKINSARILHFKDKTTKISEYHGLIFLDDKYGKIVIKKLNRKKFLGKYVNVREYKLRSSINDRRSSINFKEELGKRVADRRRGDNLLIVDDNEFKISAVRIAQKRF